MTTDPDGKPCAHNEEQAEAAKRGLMFGSFDIVAFVEAVRKETAETHQGAVAMWGLETATSMFVGQKIMDEARRRLLPPNADVEATRGLKKDHE